MDVVTLTLAKNYTDQVVGGEIPTGQYADISKMFYPNSQYGGIVSANFNTIAVSGFYTGYGTATGVPDEDYSWFVYHHNSNVGVASAYQKAIAYSTELIAYERTKISSTWGDWVLDESYSLPTASTTVLGGIKVDGETITVDENGVASSTGESYTAGDGIDITGNVISATGVPDVVDYTLSELTTFNLSENHRYNLGTRTNQTVNFLTGTDGMTIAYFTGGASMAFQNNGVEITSRKGVQTLVIGTKYIALFDWVNQELTIN